MNAPLVSIIMPAFKAGKYINEALTSARNQTYTNLEIIVVDDASPDDCHAQVEAHAIVDQRVRLLRLPRNLGQSAAVNHGITQAHGSYVKFFDADDVLSPDFIATQIASLEDKPRHLAYGIWGRFIHQTTETVFTPHPGWHDTEDGLDWILETWADTEPMYQCGLWLIPRELLDKIGGWDERLSLINDFEFFTRLVLASEGIVFTPGAKLHYRSAIADSLSAQKTRRAWESACLSTQLSIGHLLTRRDDAETRRLSAGMLQQLVYSIHPDHPDLTGKLRTEIARLGGSSLLPPGGRAFKFIARTLGWRAALRLRKLRNR